MEKITITYEDFKELIRSKTELECIRKDFIYLINGSKLDYTGDELNLNNDVLEFIKKHFSLLYKLRLHELKREKEES